MEIKSDILNQIEDRVSEEVQRASDVHGKSEEPWDMPEVPNTISLDERNMLVDALDGVEWPIGGAEAFICEWLEGNGLVKSTGEGQWVATKAGKKLIGDIENKNEDFAIASQADVFAALK